VQAVVERSGEPGGSTPRCRADPFATGRPCSRPSIGCSTTASARSSCSSSTSAWRCTSLPPLGVLSATDPAPGPTRREVRRHRRSEWRRLAGDCCPLRRRARRDDPVVQAEIHDLADRLGLSVAAEG